MEVMAFFVQYSKELEEKIGQRNKEKLSYSALTLNTAMKIRDFYEMCDY
jgi:hypothetical protein